MENSKITIITPTLNSEKSIQSTLVSCQIQTYKNVEHIVVDGGSIDLTLKMIKNVPQVKLLHLPNSGIYHALNHGIHHACGNIIGVLHSDDQFANPSVLEWVFEAFKNTDADAVYGDILYFNKNDCSAIQRIWKSGSYHKKKFLMGWMPPHTGFFIKRICFDQFGFYKPELTISADYEMMLRLLFKHNLKAIYIHKLVTKMADGGMSNRNLKNRMVAHLQDYKAWKINELESLPFTLWLKPTRKIFQFYPKFLNWLIRN
jgi:glycosyltransferase involved in cell wall biosynthesis